jgi:hypothetical protein
MEEWQFTKNIKGKEMRTIDHIDKHRAANLNKKSEFILRGQTVPSRKVERWRKRKAKDTRVIKQDVRPSDTAVLSAQAADSMYLFMFHYG